MGDGLRKEAPFDLVVFDLDGTVLDRGLDMTARVANSLAAAHERGSLVAVSSGRPRSMIPERVAGLPFLDYIMTTNGARTIRVSDGVSVAYRPMSRDLGLATLEAVQPFHAAWNAFVDGQGIFEWRCFSYMLASTDGSNVETRRMRRRIPRMEGVRNVVSVRRVVSGARQGLEKLGCSFRSEQDCRGALEALQLVGGLEVALMGEELEITAAGVTKGSALAELHALLGLDPGRTVFFGDSGNDESLAGVAGHFVAMGNASDRVRAVANEVTAPVGEDGVAVWLERHVDQACAPGVGV